MSNLFSIFDPYSGGLPLNWLAALIILLAVPNTFWLNSNQFKSLIWKIMSFVHGEFNAIMGNFFIPGSTLLPIALFIFISTNNFMGLFPYIFTASSHLTFTVALALPLWVGHMIMAWFTTPKHMLSHLTPLGTPMALAPFMVLIELVSNIIRPLTLSVRLAANMVAGHLLLTLLSSQMPFLNLIILLAPLSGLLLLMILESAVALIQSYVFSVLSTLYLNEVNSSEISKVN